MADVGLDHLRKIGGSNLFPFPVANPAIEVSWISARKEVNAED